MTLFQYLFRKREATQDFSKALDKMASEAGKDYSTATIGLSTYKGKQTIECKAYISGYGLAYGDTVENCLEATAMRIKLTEAEIGKHIDNSIH